MEQQTHNEFIATILAAIGSIIYFLVMGFGFACYSIMMSINSKKTKEIFKDNFVKDTLEKTRQDLEEAGKR